ncbi:MAG: sporulation protein YqfD, partial [Eubacteriales bacterium]|nr:sporulation protein YqfD [Eubacteriales bacterium]
TITVRGNSVLVQAERRDLTGEKLDQSAVVKVVAAREGVVQSIRAREGQPVVQPGDAVSTGDTLISGLVPPTREEGGYRLAHAQGDVQAYTMRTVDAARALTVDEKTAPHRVRRQYALLIGNKRLNLYFGSGIAGASCDKMIEIRTLRLSESVVFPVSLVVQTYVERGRTPVTRTPDEVRVEMLSRALGAVASALDGSVLRHSETLTERQGAAVLHLSVHALEQIGVEAVDDSQLPPADAPPPADG